MSDPIFLCWLRMTHYPAKWIHKSYLEGCFDGIPVELLNMPSSQKLIRRRLELEGLDWFFFSVSPAKLLFAPPLIQKRIMLMIGYLCLDVKMDRVIQKSCRQDLFAVLPQVTLKNIEGLGPFLLSSRPFIFDEIQKKAAEFKLEAFSSKVLIEVGELVFFETLSYLVRQAKSDLITKDMLDLWKTYYEFQYPECKDSSLPQKLIVEAVNDSRTYVLIRKLVKYMEPEWEILLR
ncbi:hypothetical protein [Microbulbifer sp. JMSA003]|uniref:hypothetical protein n=1 Tax=Microbulbifer sp. JMSA003 TaxID=3243369 RepID=UPI004039788D